MCTPSPSEPAELYNLAHDPKETVNLIDECPQEARRLAAMFGSPYKLKGAPIKGIQGKYEVAHTGVVWTFPSALAAVTVMTFGAACLARIGL